MRIKRHGFVRADGRLYCSLHILDADLSSGIWPRVSASCSANPIPAEIYPLENGSDAREWVLVTPFFPKSTFDVRISVGEGEALLSVPCAFRVS